MANWRASSERLARRDVEETDLTIWMRFQNFNNYWRPFTLGQGTQGAVCGYVERAEKGAAEGGTL